MSKRINKERTVRQKCKAAKIPGMALLLNLYEMQKNTRL